jgi:hypothetical protein
MKNNEYIYISWLLTDFLDLKNSLGHWDDLKIMGAPSFADNHDIHHDIHVKMVVSWCFNSKILFDDLGSTTWYH